MRTDLDSTVDCRHIWGADEAHYAGVDGMSRRGGRGALTRITPEPERLRYLAGRAERQTDQGNRMPPLIRADAVPFGQIAPANATVPQTRRAKRIPKSEYV